MEIPYKDFGTQLAFFMENIIIICDYQAEKKISAIGLTLAGVCHTVETACIMTGRLPMTDDAQVERGQEFDVRRSSGGLRAGVRSSARRSRSGPATGNS